MTLYTFEEWVQRNPIADADQTACFFCQGRKIQEETRDHLIIEQPCAYCRGTGRDVVSKAYLEYLARCRRDVKYYLDARQRVAARLQCYNPASEKG